MIVAPAALSAQPSLDDFITGPVTRCDGRTISRVLVRALPPYPEGIFRRWRALSELIQDAHITTRQQVVRHYLAFHAGEPCQPLDLAESERILRAQPFIADARVLAVDDGAGRLRVEVVTRDEVSLQGSLNVRAPFRVHGVSIGNANLDGRAVHAAIRWQEGGAYRDLIGIRLTDYQLWNQSVQGDLTAVRERLGGEWQAVLGHPFLTDLQRTAWRTSIGESRLYYRFLRPAGSWPAVAVRWDYRDIGGVVRIGVPGRLSLFGVSLSREESVPENDAVLLTGTGVRDTVAPEIEGYPRHRSARVNALWGVRSIRFLRVRGLDALDGVQDVRHGFQLGTLAGRSLPVLGSSDDDIFLAADLYAGVVAARMFMAAQVMGEGRQDYDRNRWDDIFATGRAAVYTKPSRAHTLVASMEFSAGWRQLVPFQLTIGEADAGVRGYRDSPYGGAQRLVGRLEDRWFWGRPFGVADGGTALFVDAGRLWAGDSPYGVDTKWRLGAGVGLLAGIPPRSKRMWRLDVAWPLAKGEHGGVQFRISNRDFSRVFWQEPADLRRSRGRTLPSSIFNWP